MIQYFLEDLLVGDGDKFKTLKSLAYPQKNGFAALWKIRRKPWKYFPFVHREKYVQIPYEPYPQDIP